VIFMLQYYFDDIMVLRDVIQILNERIEKYGQVDLDFVKLVIELRDKPKYADMRIKWTEVFEEQRDVKPRLRGSHWTFEFTLPEPKERY
jgi:hypothetical protein